MILRVSLADCAAKIADYMESRITHDELREWARDAMMAQEIPRAEYEEIMSLLQDISLSTPNTLRNAIKNYKVMNSPLTKGISKPWLQ